MLYSWNQKFWTLSIPARDEARSQFRAMLPGDLSADAGSNKSLVEAIVGASTWYHDLVSSRAASARDIAEQEQLDERCASQLLRLAFVDPAIVTGALDRDSAIDIGTEDTARGLILPMLRSGYRFGLWAGPDRFLNRQSAARSLGVVKGCRFSCRRP